MAHEAKEAQVLGRQLKVQKLVIPFTILGHATPASKVFTCDEPSVLFFQTEGLDRTTYATYNGLASGETVSWDQTADDSDGKINLLVKVGEVIEKICYAYVIFRKTGVIQPVYVNASGDSLSLNDDKMALSCDTSVDISTGNTIDACLVVEYVVA